MHVNSSVHVSAVTHRHCGMFLCMAVNEVGVVKASVKLRVLGNRLHFRIEIKDVDYLEIYQLLPDHSYLIIF